MDEFAVGVGCSESVIRRGCVAGGRDLGPGGLVRGGTGLGQIRLGQIRFGGLSVGRLRLCLLYTSDAADE